MDWCNETVNRMQNVSVKPIMKKIVSLLLVVSMLLLVLAACGSKDALAGTWTGDLGSDGVVTWTFDGSGKVKFDNGFAKQDSTYTISGDQVTIQLELWDDAQTFTFSVDGNSLTMNENSGVGLSGTYTKK